jgi:four helix bundle protein
MAFQSFEDLDVWKRACQLAVTVYQALRDFPDASLRDQMQRAAVSIASNIAEGSEYSAKSFAHFLVIARASAAELRTQAYIAASIGLLSREQMKLIVEETRGIARMLIGLARSLKPTSRQPPYRTPNTEAPKTNP